MRCIGFAPEATTKLCGLQVGRTCCSSVIIGIWDIAPLIHKVGRDLEESRSSTPRQRNAHIDRCQVALSCGMHTIQRSSRAAHYVHSVVRTTSRDVVIPPMEPHLFASRKRAGRAVRPSPMYISSEKFRRIVQSLSSREHQYHRSVRGKDFVRVIALS